ncbi:MAG: agmatinase [Christensenellales bacterium]
MWRMEMKTFLGCDHSYEESGVVLFGAPFDSTTSFRPGARFASSTMRSESYGLETYSPYLHKDLEDIAVCDGGDLQLCFGDTQKTLCMIEEYTANILKDGKLPVMIGGEHLVSLGAVSAAAKKYPDLHVVHFDAHTDLRDEYLGANLSHATVVRRIWDIVGDGRIHQFGIRSGTREEFIWANEHTCFAPFNFSGLSDTVMALKGKPVYFTLDLDVLDPSVLPGTGTPEPGGVEFLQLLDAVYSVCKLDIIGCDITELCPVYDQSGASTAVACKILRELLLAL